MYWLGESRGSRRTEDSDQRGESVPVMIYMGSSWAVSKSHYGRCIQFEEHCYFEFTIKMQFVVLSRTLSLWSRSSAWRHCCGSELFMLLTSNCLEPVRWATFGWVGRRMEYDSARLLEWPDEPQVLLLCYSQPRHFTLFLCVGQMLGFLSVLLRLC